MGAFRGALAAGMRLNRAPAIAIGVPAHARPDRSGRENGSVGAPEREAGRLESVLRSRGVRRLHEHHVRVVGREHEDTDARRGERRRERRENAGRRERDRSREPERGPARLALRVRSLGRFAVVADDGSFRIRRSDREQRSGARNADRRSGGQAADGKGAGKPGERAPALGELFRQPRA